MFDNEFDIDDQFSTFSDEYFYFPEDDAELASEENDSKLEFANELLQDYSFDNQ